MEGFSKEEARFQCYTWTSKVSSLVHKELKLPQHDRSSSQRLHPWKFSIKPSILVNDPIKGLKAPAFLQKPPNV
jgi:hypothetical protein